MKITAAGMARASRATIMPITAKVIIRVALPVLVGSPEEVMKVKAP